MNRFPVLSALVLLLTPATVHSGEVMRLDDVAYLAPERGAKLDLYLPADSDDDGLRPGVVIIHGGGWVGGDKRQQREQQLGNALASNGYVAISINYLLARKQEDGTWTPSWPTNLHDCKWAVHYLRENAELLRVDPNRIGVIGGSAGAHLALLVGLTNREAGLDPNTTDDFRVQAVVSLYGWSSVEDYGHTMIGQTKEEAPEQFELASPVSHASPDDPPVLLIHGTADTLIPVYHAHKLEGAFRTGGVPFETKILIGAPHAFLPQSDYADLRPRIVEFFEKHL